MAALKEELKIKVVEGRHFFDDNARLEEENTRLRRKSDLLEIEWKSISALAKRLEEESARLRGALGQTLYIIEGHMRDEDKSMFDKEEIVKAKAALGEEGK